MFESVERLALRIDGGEPSEPGRGLPGAGWLDALRWDLVARVAPAAEVASAAEAAEVAPAAEAAEAAPGPSAADASSPVPPEPLWARERSPGYDASGTASSEAAASAADLGHDDPTDGERMRAAVARLDAVPGSPLAELVTNAYEANGALLGITPDEEHDSVVGDAIVALQLQRTMLDASLVELLGNFDARQGPQADGAPTPGMWLQFRTNLDHGQAGVLSSAARRMRELPLLRSHLAAGDVSLAAATAVTSAMVPGRAQAVREAESTLVGLALFRPMRALRRALKLLRDLHDPDGTPDGPNPPDEAGSDAEGPQLPDPDDEAADHPHGDPDRALYLFELFGGLGDVRGTLDPLTSETLRVALDAYDIPDPAGTPPDQRRTPAQRRHDAFAAMLNTLLAQKSLPTVQGAHPRVLIVIDFVRLLGLHPDHPLAHMTLAEFVERLGIELPGASDDPNLQRTLAELADLAAEPSETSEGPAPDAEDAAAAAPTAPATPSAPDAADAADAPDGPEAPDEPSAPSAPEEPSAPPPPHEPSAPPPSAPSASGPSPSSDPSCGPSPPGPPADGRPPTDAGAPSGPTSAAHPPPPTDPSPSPQDPDPPCGSSVPPDRQGAPGSILPPDRQGARGGLDGVARFGSGAPVPAAQVRRLIQDASLMAVLTLGPWRPVNVGSVHRTLPAWLRTVLIAMHKTCRGPNGCDRPATWTDAAHGIPWDDEHVTDLNDTLPLCSYHHKLKDTQGWSAQLDPSTGIVTWTAPDGRIFLAQPARC